MISLAACCPSFVFPGPDGRQRLAEITREAYDLDAPMNATMTERFDVAGALLVKLFGTPEVEARPVRRTGRAGPGHRRPVRHVRPRPSPSRCCSWRRWPPALTYGVGGWLAVNGTLDAGTVVSLALLLTRLYGPLTALSNIRVDVMSTLVSFDRVFEVLDLTPSIEERAGRGDRSAGRGRLEFRDVQFRYPSAAEVSLASLEDVAALDRTVTDRCCAESRSPSSRDR